MKIIGRESTPELTNAFAEEAAADSGNEEFFKEKDNDEGVPPSACLLSSATSVSEDVEAVAESPKERGDEKLVAEAGMAAKGSAAIAPPCWYCCWMYGCF